jgi:hypothetical protein
MTIETLVCVHSSYFQAGIVLVDDKVTETAPILKYMMGWSREKVRAYVTEKKWKAALLHERELPAERGNGKDAGQDGAADEVL